MHSNGQPRKVRQLIVLGESKNGKLIIYSCFAVICWGAGSGAAWGQTTSATLVRTVTDPSGGVIRAATVTAIDRGTRNTRTTATNEEGNYTVPLLPPGEYAISVQAPGFKLLKREGVTLAANQTARLDLMLEVGATGETVGVTADAPVVQEANSTIQYSIDQKKVPRRVVKDQLARPCEASAIAL